MVFFVARSLPLLLAGRALQALSCSMVYTCGLSLLANATPSDRKGKVMGWVSMGTSIGDLNGPLVGGFLYRHGGHMAMFAVAMAIVAVDVVLCLFIVDEIPSEEQQPEEEPLLVASDGDAAYSATGAVQEHSQVGALAEAMIVHAHDMHEDAESRPSTLKSRSTYFVLLSQARTWAVAQVGWAVGMLLGPMMAAFFIDRFGWGVLCWAFAVLSGAAAVFLLGFSHHVPMRKQ